MKKPYAYDVPKDILHLGLVYAEWFTKYGHELPINSIPLFVNNYQENNSDSDLLDTFGANDITVRCTIDKSWIELSNGEKLRSYDTPRDALDAYQNYLNTHER